MIAMIKVKVLPVIIGESESVESNSWERMGATVPSDLGQRVAGAKSG